MERTRPGAAVGLAKEALVTGELRHRWAGIGHTLSLPKRSNSLSRSNCERQVFGEQIEPRFGSTRPVADVATSKYRSA